MRIIKGKIAVLLFISILAPYMGISQINESADGISRVKAETISDETEWNIKYMNAEKSYEESQNLKKIRVAVLDSGLDYDEDIPFVERKDFLGEEELHPIYQDYTGHGTSVAGLICAKKSDDRITGIAANVDLYAGRILDAENKAPVDRVIEGIEWAIEKKVNIIHMSYGTQEYSEELEEAINKAYNQGILLIAAAGNSGTAAEDESTVEYPAAFDNVISVGATNVENKKTEISSSGSELDVVAPGDQILSSGAFGGVVVEEGTSVSAAQVTGLAAVLWGKHPDKSNEFIKGLLVSGANAEAVDENCGNGIVDYEQSKQNYEKMNKVYCGFKKEGVSEKAAVKRAEESVGENTKTICEEDDVNYVNGLWGAGDHSDFVINVENIDIVKRGATEPDNISSMWKMVYHPCFHGGGNYFANVQYLVGFARQLKNAKDDTWMKAPDYLGQMDIFSVDGKKIKNLTEELSDTVLKTFYQKCGTEIECENKNHLRSYAILGLAIHTMTDAFSHRGYRVDVKYNEGICEIIHNLNIDEESKKKESAESKNARLVSRSYLWKLLIDQNHSNKTYYEYFFNHFAIADDASKMGVRAFLSKQCAAKLLASIENENDVLESFRSIFDGYIVDYKNTKTEKDSIDNPDNYRLLDVSEYWNQAKGEAGKFISLNVNSKDVNKELELPSVDKVKIKVKEKKMTVTFPKKKGYRYVVYYKTNNKSENNQVFFTGNKNYTSNVKKMSGSYIYIVATYAGKKKTKKVQVKCKVKYIYKKYSNTKIFYFKAKQSKYKLGGTVKKKVLKNLKGWSKKKNAKKPTYKLKEQIPFPGSGTLKLYGVVKKKG